MANVRAAFSLYELLSKLSCNASKLLVVKALNNIGKVEKDLFPLMC